MRWQENLSLAPEKGAPGTPESSLLPLMRSGPWWSSQATSFPPPSLLAPAVYLPALLSLLLLALSLMQTQDTKGNKDEEARVPVFRSRGHAGETGQRDRAVPLRGLSRTVISFSGLEVWSDLEPGCDPSILKGTASGPGRWLYPQALLGWEEGD